MTKAGPSSPLLTASSPCRSRRFPATALEVITLGYRQADEVIPMLRAVALVAHHCMNNRLVVKTTPANPAEIKQVPGPSIQAAATDDLGTPELGWDASRDAASVSHTTGNNAQVKVPSPPGTGNDPSVTVQSGRTHVEGRAITSRSSQDEGVTQTVQVMEGNDAFIRVGQSAPIQNTQVIRTPRGTQITQGTDFVDADTGFYVTPRVNGDRVTLEISTARDRLRNSNTGATSIQRVSTVVSGRLGEWIEIGGSSETVERSQTQALTRSRDARNEDRRVMLKVDEVR